MSGHYLSTFFEIYPAIVCPVDIDLDLMVTGEIFESNGQNFIVQVRAADASGKIWFDEIYQEEVNEGTYSGTTLGEKDVFQDLYNTIANDISSYLTNCV